MAPCAFNTFLEDEAELAAQAVGTPVLQDQDAPAALSDAELAAQNYLASMTLSSLIQEVTVIIRDFVSTTKHEHSTILNNITTVLSAASNAGEQPDDKSLQMVIQLIYLLSNDMLSCTGKKQLAIYTVQFEMLQELLDILLAYGAHAGDLRTVYLTHLTHLSCCFKDPGQQAGFSKSFHAMMEFLSIAFRSLLREFYSKEHHEPKELPYAFITGGKFMATFVALAEHSIKFKSIHRTLLQLVVVLPVEQRECIRNWLEIRVSVISRPDPVFLTRKVDDKLPKNTTLALKIVNSVKRVCEKSEGEN